MLMSKVCQGVKCVEKQSELGSRELQGADCVDGQSISGSKNVLRSKMF